MADTKELTWGDAARTDDAEFAEGGPDGEAGTAETWDAYRNWLSRAPAPTSRTRIAADASVYTWKGYRSWADKVKRSWRDRSDSEPE